MDRRKSTTVLLLVGVIGVMGTLTAFAAPLYQMFCRVTGYGGTTQVAAAPAATTIDRVITVRFNTDVNSALPWRFRPAQDEIRVKLGEPAISFMLELIDDPSVEVRDRVIGYLHDISFEPGRYLVANAGVVITKILTAKTSESINFLISGLNMLELNLVVVQEDGYYFL